MTKQEMVDSIHGSADGYQGMSDLAYGLLDTMDEAALRALWEARCSPHEEDEACAYCGEPTVQGDCGDPQCEANHA